MRLKLSIVAIGLILSLLVAFNIVWGRGENDPRAVGMGGAFTALARGIDAPDWNPANLGLSDNNRYSLNVLNLGMRFRNNSFSLEDYNRYNGKFLSESDKEDIINSIPSSGMSLDLGAEASALNFSIGNMAITYKGVGVTSFSLDRDPFRLMLLGNAVVHEVSVSDNRGEAYALGDFALSYGHCLWKWNDGEFSAGASAHYLKGFDFAGIADANGGVVTTDSGFVGSGQMAYRTSKGGEGYTIDLGLAIRFCDDWFFSTVYQNISSKIIWRRDNKQYQMWFNMRPATIESLLDESAADSLVTSGDTSYAFHAFSTRLRPAIRLGLAKEWSRVTWSFDWEQNLFDGPGDAGVNPRIACGLEYWRWRCLPLRIGAAFGGSQGSIYSIGSGLHFGDYNFDLSIANAGSPLPVHTKGARMAMGLSLLF
jgi:hypothetical protein